MAPPSASGAYRETVEAGRTLLSNCATFQTLVGAANAAAALAFINRDVILDENDGESMDRPCARVWIENYSRPNAALGTNFATGTLHFVIESAATASYLSADDGEAWACNVQGGIIDEMHVLVGAGGYVTAQDFTADHPGRGAKDETTSFWIMDILVPFGVTA